jgi:hypothetical protein
MEKVSIVNFSSRPKLFAARKVAIKELMPHFKRETAEYK